MSSTLIFKFRFTNRLTNQNREDLLKVVDSLSNSETFIKVTRLCRTRLEGFIIKPEYDKLGKKMNSRNSWALIKKVKSVTPVKDLSIKIENK